MQTVLKMVPLVLYGGIGIFSLIMAQKSLFSKGFISFHEKAAGISLDKLDKNLQTVVLALMKTTGLGFFVVGVLLLVFPAIAYFSLGFVAMVTIPCICAMYCFGLGYVNYQLHRKSGIKTPWLGALVSGLLILVGIGILMI